MKTEERRWNISLKKIWLILCTPLLLAAQPLNKQYFAQHLTELFDPVEIIQFFSSTQSFTVPLSDETTFVIINNEKDKEILNQHVLDLKESKTISKTVVDKTKKIVSQQRIAFNSDYCSFDLMISKHKSQKIQIKEVSDAFFLKNIPPDLDPKMNPVYLKLKDDKYILIYANSKDKKRLKALSYLIYLCQTQSNEI